jgi:hypothetical protein
MKIINLLIIFFVLVFFVNFTHSVGVANPDQVASDSGGGDNGEFLRRNQPQEHIIIPLINSLEAEYTFAPDIKKYRKKLNEPNKGIKFIIKRNEDLNKKVENLLKN